MRPETLQHNLITKALKDEITLREAQTIVEETKLPNASTDEMMHTLQQETAGRVKVEVPTNEAKTTYLNVNRSTISHCINHYEYLHQQLNT
jgi:hypothetical protein